jgi:hypothetical protein
MVKFALTQVQAAIDSAQPGNFFCSSVGAEAAG